MASSPRAFIRAITQSSRAHPRTVSRILPSSECSRSTLTPRNCLNEQKKKRNFTPCRSVFTSSHPRHAQETAVPRPNAAPTPPAQARPSPAGIKPTTPAQPGSANLKAGLSDQPKKQLDDGTPHIDWTTSFHGLSDAPFSKEAADVLLKPINPEDVEIKPDGIIYLPEIKYRRILNLAFGPGGWGLAPRGESTVTPKAVTREYALLAHGRLVIHALPPQAEY
jgi:Mitochondrial genome maintenance MGM101